MLQQNDILQIGPYTYTVLAVKERRALIQWTEKTGVTKEIWIIIKTMPKLAKAAA
jgi:hypothetical protein